jgi:hypothetical protein
MKKIATPQPVKLKRCDNMGKDNKVFGLKKPKVALIFAGVLPTSYKMPHGYNPQYAG